LGFGGGFLPAALRFESFGVEFVDLIGERGFADKILGGMKREIGEGVGGGVKNIGVTGKLARENGKEFQRIVGGVVGHGAVQAEQADALLKIAIGDLMDGFFQKGERFGAMAGFRKSNGTLRTRLRRRRGRCRFGRSLRISGRKDKKRNREACQEMKETIHGSIVHPSLARESSPEKERQAPKRLPFPGVLRWKLRTGTSGRFEAAVRPASP